MRHISAVSDNGREGDTAVYLSMWMVREHLKDYKMETYIFDGGMRLRNVSLLFQKASVSPHTVYICRSEEFISTLKGKVICSNRNDYLVISCDSLEEIFERVVSVFDYYQEWDLQVRQAVENKCTLQELLECSVPYFQKMICIVDPGFIFLAIAGTEYLEQPYPYMGLMAQNQGMPIEHAAHYAKVVRGAQAVREPFLYEEPIAHDFGWIYNLFFSGEWGGGSMLFLQKSELTMVQKQLFELLNEQVVLWFSRYGTAEQVVDAKQFLECILNPSEQADYGKSLRFFQRMGWKLRDAKYIYLIQSEEDGSFVYTRLKYHFRQMYPDVQFMRYQMYYLALVHDKQDIVRRIRDVLEELGRWISLTAGISFPFYDLLEAPVAFSQASLALRFGKEKGIFISDCKMHALDYAGSFLREHLPVSLAHPLVGELLCHDREHHTQYCRTMAVYLYKERSLVKTAAALSIHINTLKYRLKQIQEQFAVDLRDDGERMHLLFSFLLLSAEGEMPVRTDYGENRR